MKNWRAVTIAVVLFITMTLSGCVPDDGPILTMPPGSIVPLPPKSNQITVDVYWDATPSMKGFTKLAAGNVYRALPDMLSDLCGSMGNEVAVNFFSFGEQIHPLDRASYRKFATPEVYTEAKTVVSNVIDRADANHLSIIVTDLFEDDADWSNVTQKLRDKYFSQHLTVAIIGIKNSFYGEIFDVGLNAAYFNYNSGDDPARYRPFYLFLMGSEPQVRTFMESWKKKMSASENIKYVVFSEYFATYIPDMQNTTKKHLFDDDKLKKADRRLQEVGIEDRNLQAEFTLYGKLKENEDYCLVNKKFDNSPIKVFAWNDTIVKGESVDTGKESENIENDKEGSLLDKISAWFGKDEDAEKNATGNNDEDADKSTEGEKSGWEEQENKGDAEATFESNEDNENWTLKLTFTPGITIPWGQIALIQVQVVPSSENLQLPEWISEWDMGDIDVAPDQFDGAKTVNLKRIASSLKDYLMVDAHPAIAELYLVIDGRR